MFFATSFINSHLTAPQRMSFKVSKDKDLTAHKQGNSFKQLKVSIILSTCPHAQKAPYASIQ